MTFAEAAKSLGYDERVGRAYKLYVMGVMSIHEAAASVCLTTPEFELRITEIDKAKKANAS